MNITLIVIILLVAIVAYVKLTEMRHHLFYKALVVVVVLFLGSIGYVWFRSDVSLSSYEGFLSLGKIYFNWFGSLIHNIRGISGQVTGYDWNVNSTAGAVDTVKAVGSGIKSTFIPAP